MVRKPKIVVEPPGPKARELIEMDHQYLSPALTRTAPLVGYEAEGVWVRDPDGNEYLDFGSGIAVTNVGHRHPRVVETVKREVDRLIFVNSCDYYTIPQVHLAKKLTEITPGDFKKRVFFVNSGTEAVECGIKATRYYTQRYYFVGFINGFHGRTMGSLAFTATSPAARRRFQPMMPGVVHAPYPYCYRCPLGHREGYPECGLACLDYLENEILGHVAPPDEVAGILFEPVQGAGGYIVPPAEWVKGLRRIADEHGIVLMDDEVQAGMGRTGRWWAVEHFGVEPDVVMISKAIASGFPFGACVARSEILEWGPGGDAGEVRDHRRRQGTRTHGGRRVRERQTHQGAGDQGEGEDRAGGLQEGPATAGSRQVQPQVGPSADNHRGGGGRGPRHPGGDDKGGRGELSFPGNSFPEFSGAIRRGSLAPPAHFSQGPRGHLRRKLNPRLPPPPRVIP